MTVGHQLLAVAVAVLTILLTGAAVWSVVRGRRSDGRADHRFAVDRLVLAVAAALVLNTAVGLALVATGRRPADVLHLLYAAAAPVTLLAAWWWGGRPGGDGRVSRLRRDAWVLGAALVLLGLELRLAMTGG